MKKYIGHIPLLIIVILLIIAFYKLKTTEYVFSYEHYIALAGVIMAIIALFINDALSRVITIALLFAATFALASFTIVIKYSRFNVSLGDLRLGFKVQWYCFYLFVLSIILNWRYIITILRSKT
jgi:hypothetical protein